jgi:hypothetical protein
MIKASASSAVELALVFASQLQIEILLFNIESKIIE